MTKKQPKDITASVRQRLLNIINETGDDANVIWTRYATERLLYRLSVSEHSNNFILKGAMLFMVWTGQSYRPTMDMDLLGYGDDSIERLTEIFRAVCTVTVEPDGLVFDPDTLSVESIREEQEYNGQRVTLTAFLGKARIPIQVDIGFGDVVTPGATVVGYPTLLDFPTPHIRAYPRETVIAEKLQAMVVLGIANSRMKDFYDLYMLARDFTYDGATLMQSIKATFDRRKTQIPQEISLALTDEFGQDEVKSVQWNAFARKSGLEEGLPHLIDILAHLRDFVLPPMWAASKETATPKQWNAGGPWIFSESDGL